MCMCVWKTGKQGRCTHAQSHIHTHIYTFMPRKRKACIWCDSWRVFPHCNSFCGHWRSGLVCVHVHGLISMCRDTVFWEELANWESGCVDCRNSICHPPKCLWEGEALRISDSILTQINFCSPLEHDVPVSHMDASSQLRDQEVAGNRWKVCCENGPSAH